MTHNDGNPTALTRLGARLARLMPAAAPSESTSANPWWWAALLASVIVTALIGLFLVSMPFQLSDNLGNLLQTQMSSWSDIWALLIPGNQTRPMLWATLKGFFEVAQGHYFATFKALHIIMVGGLLLLCLRLMHVQSKVDFAAAAVSFYIIVGMHTFVGLINEGYPINNHLTPVLAAVAAANLAFSRGGKWIDWGAILLFVFTVLTVETGLLIPVVLVSAYLLGWRGVSPRAIGIIVGLMLAFLAMRFATAGTAAGLINNASGYGFSVLEPGEIASRFAGRMHLWQLYNVASSFLSILFGEPRGGLWQFARALANDQVRAHQIVEVGSSLVLFALVASYLWRRAGDWRRRQLDQGDRLVLLALPVIVANAAISFAYTKDQIIATAGVFWALAGFVAIREMLRRLLMHRLTLARAVSAVVPIMLVATAFVIRTESALYNMYTFARASQAEWVLQVDSRVDPRWRGVPAAEALVRQLRSEALSMPLPARYFLPGWLDRYEDR